MEPAHTSTDQTTDAAQRSAHVTRGGRDPSLDVEQSCCVCGKGWRLCSYAARVGPPLLQACSVECAGTYPFARNQET